MSPNLLATIEKICDTSLGFKAYAYFAREDEVDTIPTATDGVVTDPITMVTGKVFYKFAISKDLGKSKVVTAAEGDSDSSIHKLTAEIFISGISGASSVVISSMKNCEYIVILEDRDGQKFILGQKEDGVSCKPEFLHDGAIKGYKINMEAYSKIMPLEYTGTITTA